VIKSNDLTHLSVGPKAVVLVAAVLVGAATACSSSGSGTTPLGAAGMRWIPGTGNTAGGLGAAGAGGGRSDSPRVVILFCHAEREAVFTLLGRLGARQVDATTDGIAELSPRLADQRRQ